jgi:thiamine pyrophosphate-dependent acetolactate synthase large subunit-like protein
VDELDHVIREMIATDRPVIADIAVDQKRTASR